MSLMRRVAAVIDDLGSANVDQVLPYFDGYTRKQILCAMQNAAEEGLIHSKGRIPRRGGPRNGSMPAPYYPGPSARVAARKKVPARDIHCRPPASVWELAHGLQIAGTWPPATVGRRYAPLGDWNAA
jgi:hypothetical protein